MSTYLFIDSSKRNRKLYPNMFDFVVDEGRIDGAQPRDPIGGGRVLFADYVYQFDTTHINPWIRVYSDFLGNSSNIPGTDFTLFYIEVFDQYTFQTRGVYKVLSVGLNMREIILGENIPGLQADDIIVFRCSRDTPEHIFQIPEGTEYDVGEREIVIQNGSDEDGYYTGMFVVYLFIGIYPFRGHINPSTGLLKGYKIVGYDGTTKKATLERGVDAKWEELEWVEITRAVENSTGLKTRGGTSIPNRRKWYNVSLDYVRIPQESLFTSFRNPDLFPTYHVDVSNFSSITLEIVPTVTGMCNNNLVTNAPFYAGATQSFVISTNDKHVERQTYERGEPFYYTFSSNMRLKMFCSLDEPFLVRLRLDGNVIAQTDVKYDEDTSVQRFFSNNNMTILLRFDEIK